MICRRLGRALPILGAVLISAVAIAQDKTAQDKGAAAVTLDQVQPGPAARARDLDVAQPAPVPRAAAVSTPELADRAQSRALAVTPVEGTDRCDAPGADRTPLCRQRLEKRAGQYARPQPAPVTPEARLLLLTNPNGGSAGDDASGRQLGTGITAPNGPAEQLAGALRDQATPAATTSSVPAGVTVTGAPTSVPSIVVIQPK